MKVKFITDKIPQVALKELKANALRKIQALKKVEFAMNTITKEG
jgi:hypothetical protein